MVRNDLFIGVPSLFKCPISLDVMKSPVSLCTGVTYDRSSIQAWLDNGNNTCPATMQVLPSKDFVPNHNLHRLIQIWSNSENSNPQASRSEVRDLIKMIQSQNCSSTSVSKIVEFGNESDLNRRFLAESEGFVPALVEVLSNVKSGERIGLFEEVVEFWILFWWSTCIEIRTVDLEDPIIFSVELNHCWRLGVAFTLDFRGYLCC